MGTAEIAVKQAKYELSTLLRFIARIDVPATLPAVLERYNQTYGADQQSLAKGPKITVGTLETLMETGLTHRQADLLATAFDVPPWAVWPEWAQDISADALYEPTPGALSRYNGKRYKPGGLRRAIIEIANMHLGEPISPASIARELGRERTTQVYAQMSQLQTQGHLAVFSSHPARYILRQPLDLGPSAELELTDEEPETADGNSAQTDPDLAQDATPPAGPALRQAWAWVVTVDTAGQIALHRNVQSAASITAAACLWPGESYRHAATRALMGQLDVTIIMSNQDLVRLGTVKEIPDQDGQPMQVQMFVYAVPDSAVLSELKYCTALELEQCLRAHPELFEWSTDVAYRLYRSVQHLACAS
jgi:biotin operon repressor/lambda repressor-like predicted transcriptional regulator